MRERKFFNKASQSENSFFVILAEQSTWIFIVRYRKSKVITLILQFCIAEFYNSFTVGFKNEILQIAIFETSFYLLDELLAFLADQNVAFFRPMFIAISVGFALFIANAYRLDKALLLRINFDLFDFARKLVMVPLVAGLSPCPPFLHPGVTTLSDIFFFYFDIIFWIKTSVHLLFLFDWLAVLVRASFSWWKVIDGW